MKNQPKIAFPCRYPIKVIAENEPASICEAMLIIKQYYPECSVADVIHKSSSMGNYISIRVHFWATSEAQLQALFRQLQAINAVRMVL